MLLISIVRAEENIIFTYDFFSSNFVSKFAIILFVGLLFYGLVFLFVCLCVLPQKNNWVIILYLLFLSSIFDNIQIKFSFSYF